MFTRPRLGVELLEDRLTLNNRFVLPVGVPVDNVTNFATLSAALTTAGLTTGDTIQIEPGSSPGNVTNTAFTAAFSAATVLTIRGNEVVPVTALPQFTVSDPTTIAATRTLNLDNANLGLVGTGALTFNGNSNISDSVLADINSSAGTPFIFAGRVNNLTNSTVVNTTAVPNSVILIATNAAGTSHLISGNTFVSSARASAQISWDLGSGVPVTDVLTGNNFQATQGVFAYYGVVVEESISGLVIQGNQFSGPFDTGILLFSRATNVQILNNTIDVTGVASTGIWVSPNGASSASVVNNVIKTGGVGTGLRVNPATGGNLSLKVQGNDFHANQIGVRVTAGANSIANVDLGGGTQGSLGGNNFRGFTAAATATAGAIVTDHTTGSMFAQRNLFTVADPQTVVFRSGAGTVSTSNQLTGNAAFVQALYTQFLRRTGDTTNASDAGGWVNFMTNGGTQSQVANGIIRSQEALGYVVDDLYRTVLNRAADPAGRQNFVNLLGGGQTIEAVQSALYGSAEYQSRYPGDAAFVTSLYWSVLGRSPDNVAYWVNQIPSQGRAGVAAGFIQSTEYRTTLVKRLYSEVLKRATAPTPSEVTPWVNSGLDLLTLRVSFASTLEFFLNG